MASKLKRVAALLPELDFVKRLSLLDMPIYYSTTAVLPAPPVHITRNTHDDDGKET
jgi:hypothetical protein